MGNQQFQCKSDAEKTMKPLLKSLKYYRIDYQIMPIERHAEKGRPKLGAKKEVIGYQIQASLSSCLKKIAQEKKQLGDLFCWPINTDGQRHRIVANVKKVHQRIIVYFGKHALNIYDLPTELKRVEINYANYKNLLH